MDRRLIFILFPLLLPFAGLGQSDRDTLATLPSDSLRLERGKKVITLEASAAP